MKVPDLVRRLGAMFTWPTTERRTVFVHNDDPWYELYYDGRAQAVLEYKDLDGRTIQRLLSRDQEKEFGRRGPAYIAELYRATAAGRVRGDTPTLAPAVEQRLRDDYPDVTRWIAAKHLASYGADRPHQARVQLAVLSIAGGNVHAVKTWIERAAIDCRWVLRQAGDTDTAPPLALGAQGIDAARGAIVGAEGSILPSVTKSGFMASPLFSGERFSPREEGEAILRGVPLALHDAVFHPALRFDGHRLTEVWLESPDVTDPRAWLDARLPGWQGVFAWGTVDVEGSAIVVGYSAAAAGDAQDAP
jgi:hypothetical protein